MRPATRLNVEPLESRTLLSGGAATGPGLATSLTVDRSALKPGQSVVITFTETNVSRHDVTVVHGPADEGFVASRDGRVVWRSNAGPEPRFLRREVLHPGQSIRIRATWDGRSNQTSPADPPGEGSPLRGTVVIRNQLAPRGPSASVTIGAPGVTPLGPIDRHL